MTTRHTGRIGLAGLIVAAGLALGAREARGGDAAGFQQHYKIHAESPRTDPKYRQSYKTAENFMGLYAVDEANAERKRREEAQKKIVEKTHGGMSEQDYNDLQELGKMIKADQEGKRSAAEDFNPATQRTVDMPLEGKNNVYYYTGDNSGLVGPQCGYTEYGNEKFGIRYFVKHSKEYFRWLWENDRKTYFSMVEYYEKASKDEDRKIWDEEMGVLDIVHYHPGTNVFNGVRWFGELNEEFAKEKAEKAKERKEKGFFASLFGADGEKKGKKAEEISMEGKSEKYAAQAEKKRN